MNVRKPIYKDLLDQGIIEAELNAFMQGLLIQHPSERGSLPVTSDIEIDQPIYRARDHMYYHTALCYATDTNNIKIAEALLKIGASPNTVAESATKGSALLLALYSNAKQVRPEILALLLSVPDIDIYVMQPISRSAFFLTRGSEAMILQLLQADRAVADLPDDEKKAMAVTIANTMKPSCNINDPQQARRTDQAVCQSLRKVYPTEQEAKELTETIDQYLPPVLSPIVLSYLFRSTPVSLLKMENSLLLFKNEEVKPEEIKPVKVQPRGQCSVM